MLVAIYPYAYAYFSRFFKWGRFDLVGIIAKTEAIAAIAMGGHYQPPLNETLLSPQSFGFVFPGISAPFWHFLSGPHWENKFPHHPRVAKPAREIHPFLPLLFRWFALFLGLQG